MSKKGSKTVDLAQEDKRIRERQAVWKASEVEAVQSALMKLPDQTEQAEFIDCPQPALTTPEGEAEGGAAEDGATDAATESSAAEGASG